LGASLKDLGKKWFAFPKNRRKKIKNNKKLDIFLKKLFILQT